MGFLTAAKIIFKLNFGINNSDPHFLRLAAATTGQDHPASGYAGINGPGNRVSPDRLVRLGIWK